MTNKNSIIYVLTSEGNDIYSLMTRVSIASIRITNSHYQIILVCDSETQKNLKLKNDIILKEVDEIVSFNVNSESATYRNRDIKTRLKTLIPGKILFLDSDTIIRGSLDDIFKIQAEIALAPNHSSNIYGKQIWNEDKLAISDLGWVVNENVYYNGGVIFYNDKQKTIEFSDIWYKKWKYSFEKTNRYRDQPALNCSIYESGIEIQTLDHKYNYQFKMADVECDDAVIWHYYSSDTESKKTKVQEYLESKMYDGRIRNLEILNIISNKSPYGFLLNMNSLIYKVKFILFFIFRKL